MGEGMYKTFLGVNVVGHIVCLSGTVIGFLLHQYVPALQLGGGAACSDVPPALAVPQLATLASWGGLSLGSYLRHALCTRPKSLIPLMSPPRLRRRGHHRGPPDGRARADRRVRSAPPRGHRWGAACRWHQGGGAGRRPVGRLRVVGLMRRFVRAAPEGARRAPVKMPRRAPALCSPAFRYLSRPLRTVRFSFSPPSSWPLHTLATVYTFYRGPVHLEP